MIHVRVPASSANLGPAFDGLAVALTLAADIGVVDAGDDDASGGTPSWPKRAHVIDETHPADVAFREGGGTGRLWVRSPIPMGRGLGYSGAVRVGGLAAALVQQHGADVLDVARPEMLAVTSRLEGHADNVAASIYGGVVATSAGRAVQVPLGFDPAVLVWVPSRSTLTNRSRSSLPSTVSFGDAVFNVTHTALLVAALAAGDTSALIDATQDRLHQDRRLAAVAPTRAALASALEAGAWCAWLSGSGPTIAMLCDRERSAAIAAALPPDGDVKHLAIDSLGVRIAADGPAPV